jgi:hypothetical protein
MPVHLGNLTCYSIVEIRMAFPESCRPSLETLRRHIRDKKLRGRKIGASWYVTTVALEAYFKDEAPPEDTAKALGLP